MTSAVDGTYADGPESLRVLIGAPTYTRATEVYRGTTTENEDGYEVMRRLSGGVRVSAHVPGVVSKRQDAIVARAMSMTHAVCPIWDAVTLIPDEITLGRIRADQDYCCDALCLQGDSVGWLRPGALPDGRVTR